MTTEELPSQNARERQSLLAEGAISRCPPEGCCCEMRQRGGKSAEGGARREEAASAPQGGVTNQGRSKACSWTPATARPLGSFRCLKAASHAKASAVEQATLGTLGTLRAALSEGKCSAKMER